TWGPRQPRRRGVRGRTSRSWIEASFAEHAWDVSRAVVASGSLLAERGVALRSLPGRPVERVVLAAVAPPRIERVHDVRELGTELGDRAQEDPLERRDLHLVAVWLPLLHDLAVGAVVGDPADPHVAVELGPEARGEEPVAEEPARRVEDEHLELRLGDREAMRPRELGQPAHHGVDVLHVVHEAAVGSAETVVDRAAVGVALGAGDGLRGVAAVLAVDLAKDPDQPLLLRARRGAPTQPRADEIVQPGEWLGPPPAAG